MDYYTLPRKDLQVLCKKHGIPANKTNVFMAEALAKRRVPLSEVSVNKEDNDLFAVTPTKISCGKVRSDNNSATAEVILFANTPFLKKGRKKETPAPQSSETTANANVDDNVKCELRYAAASVTSSTMEAASDGPRGVIESCVTGVVEADRSECTVDEPLGGMMSVENLESGVRAGAKASKRQGGILLKEATVVDKQEKIGMKSSETATKQFSAVIPVADKQEKVKVKSTDNSTRGASVPNPAGDQQEKIKTKSSETEAKEATVAIPAEDKQERSKARRLETVAKDVVATNSAAEKQEKLKAKRPGTATKETTAATFAPSNLVKIKPRKPEVAVKEASPAVAAAPKPEKTKRKRSDTSTNEGTAGKGRSESKASSSGTTEVNPAKRIRLDAGLKVASKFMSERVKCAAKHSEGEDTLMVSVIPHPEDLERQQPPSPGGLQSHELAWKENKILATDFARFQTKQLTFKTEDSLSTAVAPVSEPATSQELVLVGVPSPSPSPSPPPPRLSPLLMIENRVGQMLERLKSFCWKTEPVAAINLVELAVSEWTD